ncbi:metal-dependent transcriptional regulator [Fusibacter sp. JL216-2]|uniref:metal-dependent transcriptional regulator n=1 Tax=Fusibacter sp. JL216-2 TaxID=3071453 RepID=UPI003D32F154
MSVSESTEMYLETVYLLEKNHGHAHVVDIAKRLGVSKPSVSKAMKQLKEKGLISKEAYGSITLTSEGRSRSEKIYQEHQLISLFLEHSLNLPPDEASENACKMEHILSDNMIDSIKTYLRENNIEVKLK